MKKLSLLTAVLLGASALPAAAQSVYLPMAQNGPLAGGNQLRTRLEAANASFADRRFSTFFVASEIDGSSARPELPKITVGPQATSVVNLTTPTGVTGYVEVTGAPQMRYQGKLETLDAQGNVIGATTLPLLTDTDFIAANTAITLMGLTRTSTRTTGLGVLNIGTQQASCTITFRRADGSEIVPAALITVPKISVRFFADTYAAINTTAITDARIAVSCDQPFFPYALVMGTDGTHPVFVAPATSGASKLFPPGAEPPPPPGSVVLNVAGEFLNARQGDSYKMYDLAVDRTVDLRKLEYSFDIALGNFPNPLFHTLTSIRGNGPVFVATIRADRQRTVIDTEGGSIGQGGTWEPRSTYRVRVVLDVTTDEFYFEVKRGGEILQQISGELGVNRIETSNGLRLDFSQDRVYDEGAYWPLWGSRFSNLQFVGTP